MFKKVFIEKNEIDHPRTKSILENLGIDSFHPIDNFENYFNKVKKPYLQKREDLNLYIGKKRGSVIKEAPDAYGVQRGKHYYFIHAYNCIYECHYCYLQGYFSSPDIVLFVNYEDIGKEIQKLSQNEDEVWFHAGEFSDSLALSHITGEIPFFYDLFKDLPQARLELRSKSVNIKELLKVSPLENIVPSFSLAPQNILSSTEDKTPPLKTRLKAIEKLSQLGHPIGIHLDPIIYTETFLDDYELLFKELKSILNLDNLQYISIGVVRFSKDSYYQTKSNYPKSLFFAQDMITSFDGKVRYPRPLRLWMLQKIKQLAIDLGFRDESIYLCMED